MKAFLKQLARFCLLSAGILAVVFVLHGYAYYRLCNKALELPTGVDTIVLGHSHAERDVNPAFFPRCLNVAQTNEGYDINLLKMHALFIRNPKQIKRIILPLAYGSFVGSSSGNQNAGEAITNTAWSKEKERRYAFLQYREENPRVEFHLKLLRQSWVWPSKKTLLVMVRYVLGSAEWVTNLGFLGGYKRSYYSMLTQKMLSNALSRFPRNVPYELNRTSLDYVQRILVECAESGVKAELVFFPVHADFRAGVPSNYVKKLNGELTTMANALGAHIHDFSGFALEDRCFQDYTHLNAYGSDFFTPVLYEALQIRP